MLDAILSVFSYLTPILALITLIYSYYIIRRKTQQIEIEKKEIAHRIYEIQILREIGERIGYELNIERILETIVSSLNHLVNFSVASYMILSTEPDKVLYRAHLNESVGHKFLDQVRDYLLSTLNDTFQKKYTLASLQERISGTIIDDVDAKQATSLWVVPLKINSRGVGVLALASTKKGMFTGSEMELLEKILAQANRAVNQLEEVINNEQSKIYSMVSAMPDGVLMLDVDNGLVGINKPAIKMLGLENHEDITILDVVASLAEKIDLRAKIAEAVKAEGIIKVENLQIGNMVVRVYISPATNKSQKLIGSVVVLHDVTAESQLNRLRDDFTAMMVHELRAPLTLIHGTTDMFLTQPEIISQDQGKQLLETMSSSSSSMLDLVNDLLDAAKIEAGKFQILKSPADLNPVVSHAVTAFSKLATDKQISLEYKTPPAPTIIPFDSNRISQVFNNLLSNAIKFTPQGGKIEIMVGHLDKAEEFRPRFNSAHPVNLQSLGVSFPCTIVSISDTGSGIAENQIKDLFSKFKQLERNTSSHKGTGLGLVIAKGIVESHGGKIFVESEENTGTTFYFTLPEN